MIRMCKEYFYSNIKINNENVITLTFSEPLENFLDKNQIIVYIDQNMQE